MLIKVKLTKKPSKCDCIKGIIIYGSKHTVLFCFSLERPPGHKLGVKTEVFFLIH